MSVNVRAQDFLAYVQQDVVSCHCTAVYLNYLNGLFTIIQNKEILWPVRSCNLRTFLVALPKK